MVIMERQDNINKSNIPLTHPAYRAIPSDPTNKIKTKLINTLKRVKNQTGLDNSTYKAMYPNGCGTPKYYGFPKIHKPYTPLRPIVSSCGLVTNGVAKECTKILKPLIGKSLTTSTACKTSLNRKKCSIVTSGMLQLLWCYSSVYLSPIGSSPRYYQGSTGKIPHPHVKNSNVSRGHSSSIRILPQNIYFSFQGQFCELVEGVAMGSPVSPILANLYMVYFEQKALSTASHPLGYGTSMWMTLLSSKRKEINKTSYNTLTVLTQLYNSQWKTIRSMVPSPS